jgi:hypothetical protein
MAISDYNIDKENIMAEPKRCPVCNGTGNVDDSFYNEPRTSIAKVPCRSCNGCGIVWDYSTPSYIPPYCPYYNPIPIWITESNTYTISITTDDIQYNV